MKYESDNGKTVATLLANTKIEIEEFIRTRASILKLEIREKLASLKLAAPVGAVAILLLTTAYLLLTMALVSVVTAFFHDNPYRWALGFLAVAVVWSILAGAAGYFAKREFTVQGLLPKRTIEILKADKLWLQSESGKNP